MLKKIVNRAIKQKQKKTILFSIECLSFQQTKGHGAGSFESINYFYLFLMCVMIEGEKDY